MAKTPDRGFFIGLTSAAVRRLATRMGGRRAGSLIVNRRPLSAGSSQRRQPS